MPNFFVNDRVGPKLIVNRKFTIKCLLFEADEVARRLLLSEEIGETELRKYLKKRNCTT